MTDTSLNYAQEDIDRVFAELATLSVDLDDDPLVYGPKRLNLKTAQVRRMLDRCENLYLSVSHRLQATRRALRIATLDLDLAKKHLYANDPETRAGRSVSDRDAIASGKLTKETMAVHDLNVAAEDLDAVLTVVKAKRTDLKDTEGRLRDQVRLCSEEIGLGGKWGTRVPNAPAVQGMPARATSGDIEDLDRILQGVDGEIALARDGGQWEDPPNLEEQLPPPPDEILDSLSAAVEGGGVMPNTPLAVLAEPPPETTPLVLNDAVSQEFPKRDMDAEMPVTEATAAEVDLYLDEVQLVSMTSAPLRPSMSKAMDDVDVDSLLEFFEAP